MKKTDKTDKGHSPLGRSFTVYLALALLLALPQGCELESERYDVINTSAFPKTAEDADALLAGNCYAPLSANWGALFGTTDGIHKLCEIISDIGDYRDRERNILSYVRWTGDHSHWALGLIDNTWQNFVPFISKMILTIDRINGVDMDETKKNRFLAEARCALGLLSFTLYDLYGPLPLPDLETLKNPLEEKILPRATEEQMQAFIEDNLRAAAEAPELPYSYKKGDADYGRFTKGIAYMVLLKHYMQCGKWAEAEAAGRELLKPEYGYGLVPRYKDIFTLANEKNEETIFSFSSSPSGSYRHQYLGMVLPPDYPTGIQGFDHYNYFRVMWWFAKSFDPDDERGQSPVLITEYEGKDASGNPVHRTETSDPNTDTYLKWGALPVKYEIDPGAVGSLTNVDYIIYRYADVLTLLAEAIVRNGGNYANDAAPDGPIYLLNRVRLRAFNYDQSKAYTTGSIRGRRDFLDKLMMERAWELYWENGSRRQDLIRDGQYVERIQYKAAHVGETTLVSDAHVRFPVPDFAIRESKGMIYQNPGY
jgi:hypothetical protein